MRVAPPDLELFLTRYVRARALADGQAATVTNKEPTTLTVPLTTPLIIIRDDSGTRTGWTTFDRSIGASVLAGSKTNDKPANDLARWLSGVLFDEDIALANDSPITSVDWTGCNGPYAVTEQLDVARRYMTAQYGVTGSW